jgi:uncharacterized protein with FMN-binding domain
LRRALLTIGGTVAGLAALLSFKTHPLGVMASAAPASPGAGSSPATPPAAAQGIGTVNGAGHASATARPTTAKQGSAAKPASTAGRGSATASSTRTVTGSVASTQYGPMQVAITVTGKHITKVTVVQQTDLGAQSSQIDAMAIPRLKSETLTAQSANIDAVSGATYTSSGYKQSLQSALDMAGV